MMRICHPDLGLFVRMTFKAERRQVTLRSLLWSISLFLELRTLGFSCSFFLLLKRKRTTRWCRFQAPFQAVSLLVWQLKLRENLCNIWSPPVSLFETTSRRSHWNFLLLFHSICDLESCHDSSLVVHHPLSPGTTEEVGIQEEIISRDHHDPGPHSCHIEMHRWQRVNGSLFFWRRKNRSKLW